MSAFPFGMSFFGLMSGVETASLPFLLCDFLGTGLLLLTCFRGNSVFSTFCSGSDLGTEILEAFFGVFEDFSSMWSLATIIVSLLTFFSIIALGFAMVTLLTLLGSGLTDDLTEECTSVISSLSATFLVAPFLGVVDLAM